MIPLVRNPPEVSCSPASGLNPSMNLRVFSKSNGGFALRLPDLECTIEDGLQSYKLPPLPLPACLSMTRTSFLSGDFLVAVGSKNPAKTEGAKSVFRIFFPDCRLAEVDTRAVARAQPVGLDQVVEGASARARFALSEALADFGVGVEAGLISVPTGETINLQIAAIVDNEGRSGVGFSSGFVIPTSFLKRMSSEGTELDRYSHEITRAEKISEEEGIVYHLTKGRTSRLQMTEQCVSMALIPWLNPQVYGH